jgi:hypothetical protein
MLKRDRDMSKMNAQLQQQLALYEASNLALQQELAAAIQKQTVIQDHMYEKKQQIESLCKQLHECQRENTFMRSLVTEYYARNPHIKRKI